MGRDKLGLEVRGKPLLQRVAAVLRARCDEVIVVGANPPPLPVDHRSVPDARPGGLGPLAGLEAGLAASRCPLAFVAAGDMPFLRDDLVGYLLERLAAHGAPAVVPRPGGLVHPLCAAYSRDVLPLVRSALDDGTRAVRDFLAVLDAVEYVGESELQRFGDPGVLLTNVNSPEDLAQARQDGGAP